MYFASTNESSLTALRTQAVGNYCPHLNRGTEGSPSTAGEGSGAARAAHPAPAASIA